MILIHNSEKS